MSSQPDPNEKTLIVNDWDGEYLVAYDIQPDGTLKNRRNFAKYDLQQKTAFTVDVIGCHAIRRGYENIDLLVAHLAVKFGSADLENVRHAVREQLSIGRIMFGALDGNPGAGRLYPPDRLVDREGGRGSSPALVKVRNACVIIAS